MTLATPWKDPGQGRPVLDEFAARQADGLKQLRPGNDQFGPGSSGRLGQAGNFETAFRIIDGIVGHQHLGRPGLPTQPGHRGQQFRIGGRPQGGRGSKGGIDLDQDLVALADKSFHPAQGLDSLLDHYGPVLAVNNGHFTRPRGQGRIGKIPQTGQGLLLPGRGRTLGVVEGQAQPAHGQSRGRGKAQAFQKIPAGQVAGLVRIIVLHQMIS